MGYYTKIPPKQCCNCGYSASGSAFVKEFGRWYFGKPKCPICGSKEIVESKLKGLPPPKGVPITC